MIELGFQFVSPYSAHKTLVSLVTNSEFHIPYFIGNTLEKNDLQELLTIIFCLDPLQNISE